MTHFDESYGFFSVKMYNYATYINSNSTDQSPSLEANSHSSSQGPAYMELEGTLPCSQEPVTGPCPESRESSPQLPILFP
jgi:hypothetical protein